MDSPWKSVSCLKIMKVRFGGCLRLICIAVAGLGAPLSRFLEGAPYKFLNEFRSDLSQKLRCRNGLLIHYSYGTETCKLQWCSQAGPVSSLTKKDAFRL